MSPCLYAGEREDERHPCSQEAVRCGQAARLAACAVQPRAGSVVAVVAQVGRDEAETRRRALAAEVLRQMARGRRRPVGAQGPEGDHIGVAFRGVVDHRVEPHERVVPRGVLVSGRRHLGRVRGADGGVPAVRATGGIRRPPVPGRRVAHVLLVGAPGRNVARRVRRVLRVELGRDRWHGRRVHTTLTVHLPGVDGLVGIGRAGGDVGEGKAVARTVGLGVLRRRLAGDLGDVVVQTDVPGGVEVREQLALVAERAVQVGGRGDGSERGVVALVLQLDHQDVVDLPGRQGGAHDGWARCARRRRGDRGGRDEQDEHCDAGSERQRARMT